VSRNTLKDFRHDLYGCFQRARDALWNLVDALSSEPTARSLPELSLSPLFQRKWASVYEACEDGRIDEDQLREIFVRYAPLPAPGRHVFLGVDTSNLFRPEAETTEDRLLLPVPNLPEAAHVVSPGWVISSVVLLPTQPEQGTFVLDPQRVRCSEVATEVAARQLKAVIALLVARGLKPIMLGDRWDACAPFLTRIGELESSGLL